MKIVNVISGMTIFDSNIKESNLPAICEGHTIIVDNLTYRVVEVSHKFWKSSISDGNDYVIYVDRVSNSEITSNKGKEG